MPTEAERREMLSEVSETVEALVGFDVLNPLPDRFALNATTWRNQIQRFSAWSDGLAAGTRTDEARWWGGLQEFHAAVVEQGDDAWQFFREDQRAAVEDRQVQLGRWAERAERVAAQVDDALDAAGGALDLVSRIPGRLLLGLGLLWWWVKR